MSVKAEPIHQRRPVRARVAAERLALCERTIRSYQAEYRNDYEVRAAERRAQAFRLRHLGNSWAEVGKAMGGISAGAARQLAHRYRSLRIAAPDVDSSTPDMFDRK